MTYQKRWKDEYKAPGNGEPEDEAHKSQDRPCLCCGEVFRSKWIGNRLCSACRGKTEGII